MDNTRQIYAILVSIYTTNYQGEDMELFWFVGFFLVLVVIIVVLRDCQKRLDKLELHAKEPTQHVRHYE